MIDASVFASSYNSFWKTNSPTFEHFVRQINLNGKRRVDPPMDVSLSKNNSLIAELGFSLFFHEKRNRDAETKLGRDAIHDFSYSDAVHRISAFGKSGVHGFELTEGEFKESETISRRLSQFFNATLLAEEIFLRPIFSGCGYIDASEGDIIFGDTLFEVKTVHRPVRGIDVKQLLTYAALNFSDKKFKIDMIGIFNPRLGICWSSSVEDVCQSVSGLSSQQFLSTLVQTISSGEISR